ncbi:MAG: TonB-dependent receptor [Paramuribaculum sp.]|nr:TonB-dependent receptor [Paramuribaculum sp.]
MTLEDDVETLDEVVVVGFGSQKKANLTGAVSTVSGKEIAARPVNTVADALQGMAAGLDVLGAARGGQLGAARSMNIRGTGTIGSGSSVNPLVLIDGMEGDINQLNPADVENISILKDAAASSIYGSRAAGGVILITTRTGKEGKVTVNYSDSFRWSKAVGMPKMANSYIWANVMNNAALNSGGTWFTQDYLDALKEVVDGTKPETMFRNTKNNRWEVWDGDFGPLPQGNTDWLDEHFGKTPFSQEHNISLTGGTDKYDFYFSGNILSQEGILRYGDDNMQRYTVNSKINVYLTKWLTFGYSARWYRGQYDAPSFVSNYAGSELYHNIARYWPIIPTHDPNGYPVVESFIDAMENGGRYKNIEDKFDQQFSFIARPLEGLTVNAEFNYRSTNTNTSQDIQQTYGWDVDGVPYPRNPNGYPYGAGGEGSQMYEYNYRSNYFNPNIYGTYSHTFAEDHNFKVMAGFQSEWYHYKSFNASRNGIINGLPFLSMTDGETIKVGSGAATWSTAGWFGRINYDYKGRYLVEGNIRYDGSSRFRKDSRWTTSPSFSLGWNIANEAFMENSRRTVNTLKLRYSWGKLGNQNTDNWYPTYVTMGYAGNNAGWLVNGTDKNATAWMPGLVSSTLTWEKNRTWDIGLDWGLFNNRFTGTIDYYNRRTQDMVGPGEVLPGVFGANVPNVNNLSMTSKGWELTVSWRDRIQDFAYGVTFNLYDHTTTVDEYPNENKSLSSYYNGAKLGDIWGLTTVGLAKTDEEMNAHLKQLDQNYANSHEGQLPAQALRGQNQLGTGWKAGDIMYADLDGDGQITSGEWTLDDHGDYSVIGNTTPRYNFGLNLEAQWKGFDLKVFFQGTMKRDYWAGSGNEVFWGASGIGKWWAMVYEPHLDYFRPEGTDDILGQNVNAYYPRVNWGGPNNRATQTRYLQNAAYCRLKNVTVGYTLPQNITRKAYIERARVFVSGENLATITNFSKLGDPELIEAYNSSWGFGKVYPLSRVFSVGLNVTF